MNVDIVCSSRELFGADRCALKLADVLRDLGARPSLVLPAHRPECGLAAAAQERGIDYREEPVAVATSGGLEHGAALRPGPGRRHVDLRVLNSSAVLGNPSPGRTEVLILREWLDPASPRHRLLAAGHRVRSDAVVGISRGVIGQWRQSIRGPRRQFVVPDWLDEQVLAAAEAAPPAEDKAGIVCLGRFNGWKGQEVLAEAFEIAFGDSDDRPPMTFVGAQPGTEFAARADSLAERGQTAGWTVEPFVEDPEPFLRRAALLVLPSLHPEPFGLVVIEALAWGCQVIAFPGGGPDDVAGSFPGVMHLSERSPEALAAALREWWTGGGQAQTPEQRQAALEALRSNWSPQAASNRWRQVLGRLEEHS